MKKLSCMLLLIVLALSPVPAMGSPGFFGETVTLTFESTMHPIVPAPCGRWIDELFALLSVRAERLTWEDGSLMEWFFLVNEEDACSLGLLSLEDELYLCGTLLPEGPILLDPDHADILRAFPADALFAEVAGDAREEIQALTIPSLGFSLRELSMALRGLKSDPTRENSLEAAAVLLEALAETLEANGTDEVVLRIARTPVENAYGYLAVAAAEPMEGDLSDIIFTRFFLALAHVLEQAAERS